MSQSLSRAVFGFAVLLVGLVTTIYAADVAHDGANSEAEVIQTIHPVVESILPLLPFVLFIVVGFGIIGAAAFLKRSGPTVGGGLR